MKNPCRHCGTSGYIHRRGLCQRCYDKKKIRHLHGPVSPFGNKALTYDCAGGRPLPKPTDAIPGSPEKIAVMAERFRKRQQIHHPRDAKRDPEER